MGGWVSERVAPLFFCQVNKGCLTTLALPFTLKSILRSKEENTQTQIFHHAKIWSSKNPLKETKSLKILYNSITNLKFQHKPKYHLSKSLYQNRSIINYLVGAKIHWASILYNEPKHNILALVVGKANKLSQVKLFCVGGLSDVSKETVVSPIVRFMVPIISSIN